MIDAPDAPDAPDALGRTRAACGHCSCFVCASPAEETADRLRKAAEQQYVACDGSDVVRVAFFREKYAEGRRCVRILQNSDGENIAACGNSIESALAAG